MSAPKTDIEKQVRLHRPVMFGISTALATLAAVGAALVLWNEEIGDDGADPGRGAAGVESEGS